MTSYQAGIGPNTGSCHIYKIDPEARFRMSLCESVNVVRNYKGPISASHASLCRRCFRKLQQTLPEGAAITAELIGVASIEE